jgi:hypothetical protein
VETERALSSRLCLVDSDQKSGLEKQMDETNRKHYRKALTVHTNIINLLFDPNAADYNFTILSPFFQDLLDLCQVGLIEPVYDGED